MKRLVFTLLFLSSCRYGATYLDVSVSAPGIEGIDSMRCAVTPYEGGTGTIDISGVPGSFTVQLPSSTHGAVTLAIDGLMGTTVVASGSTSVNVHGAGDYTANVTLTAGGAVSSLPAWLPVESLPHAYRGVNGGVGYNTSTGSFDIYVTSGIDASGATLPNVLTLYTLPSVSWQQGAAIDSTYESSAAADFANDVTVVGGHGSSGAVETTRIVPQGKGSILPGPYLLQPRQSLVVLGTDNALYAIGGSDGTTNQSDVEVLTNSTWQAGVSLSHAVSAFAGAVGFDKKLYIFGGDHSGGEGTSSEAYSWAPGDTLWQGIPSLAQGRCNHAATQGGDARIWVTGGDDCSSTPTSMTSVEIYDTSTGTFTAGPALTTARAQHAALIGADGRLYVIGGVDDSGNLLDTVEAYGPLLSLGKASGTSGTTIPFTGSNFAANASVGLRLQNAGTALTTVTSDASGAISGSFVVPQVTPENDWVQAIDAMSKWPVVAQLSIQ